MNGWMVLIIVMIVRLENTSLNKYYVECVCTHDAGNWYNAWHGHQWHRSGFYPRLGHTEDSKYISWLGIA